MENRIRSGYKHRTADAVMIEFPGTSFRCHDDVQKAFAVGNLLEYHRKQ